ncbi:hypothetical protein [Lentibacillus sp. CBA3610]|uniref:hypothetical protein n=1 Tax=Lentibacillus sp. CBA3610 TaxID=2518176 RepID=UPI001595061B|nr:hypothetical protein [Lentibacillus sp. CBA3610]QKY69747.1 hypothetical protein Len3610_09185 [Lentibacillus sp. CBA3610]
MRLFSVIGLLIGLFIPIVTEAEENTPSPQQLEKFTEDVTGNSTNETIELNGVLFAPDSNYYEEIWTTISDNDGQEWEITYEGGYEPDIQFYDLTHDGVNDMLYQSSANKSGDLYHYHLHTLKNDHFEEIPLPEQENIQADFKDDFKVDIQIDHEKEPNTVDVQNRSSEYVQLGIYDEDGNLVENTTPIIEPIAFYEPVEISERNGFAIRSYQQINGAYQADRLGTVETLWYYENEEWIILKTEWVPA